MRIMLLSQFFPPVIGGEERHVYLLGKTLAARGHTVSVVTHAQPDCGDIETLQGMKIYRVGTMLQHLRWLYKANGRRHAPPLADPQTVSSLQRILAIENPDIVHAHNWLVNAYLPLKKQRPARLVLSLHDYSLVCGQKRLRFREEICSGPGYLKCATCCIHHYGLGKGLATHFANWAMIPSRQRLIDLFLPVSGAVARGNRLAENGLPFEIIPNFIGQDGHTEDDDSPIDSRLPKGDFVLFVGDLTLDKGVGVLLEAHKRCQRRLPLVLIGRQAQNFNLAPQPDLIVLDALPHAQIMQAWQRAAIAVMPSIWPEPFPTVVLEAMQCGCPVIASNIGGMPDQVIDGETGLLVPPGDSLALALAIDNLSADPARRKAFGTLARQHVQRFEAAVVVTQIERSYERLLAHSL